MDGANTPLTSVECASHAREFYGSIAVAHSHICCDTRTCLSKQVPHMCAFLMTTLFPQTFCLAFLAFFQEHQLPADSIIGSIHMGFLVSRIETTTGLESGYPLDSTGTWWYSARYCAFSSSPRELSVNTNASIDSAFIALWYRGGRGCIVHRTTTGYLEHFSVRQSRCPG